MPPRRTPTLLDFPSTLTLSITPSPTPSATSTSPPAPAPNILLLLHGLGDTHSSLTSLAKSMNLPETTCISIRAPTPLPFDLGRQSPNADPGAFHWGDDLVFDEGRPDDGVDVEGCGYSRAVSMVREVVDVLGEKCGYTHRDVMILGLGQGGGVGLAYAAALARSSATEGQSGSELGGVISLGGALPDDYTYKDGKTKGKTPILVCHGRSQSAILVSRAKAIKDAFEYTQIVEWKRAGDGMARNREEMMPIMQFFGRRLRSRTGVPEGAVEVG